MLTLKVLMHFAEIRNDTSAASKPLTGSGLLEMYSSTCDALCIRLIILFESRHLFWREHRGDRQRRPGEVSPRREFNRCQLKQLPRNAEKKENWREQVLGKCKTTSKEARVHPENVINASLVGICGKSAKPWAGGRGRFESFLKNAAYLSSLQTLPMESLWIVKECFKKSQQLRLSEVNTLQMWRSQRDSP